MSKTNIFFFLLAFFSLLSFAQDNNKDIDNFRNKGYFNITKISFITVHELKRDFFVPGEGGFYSDLDNSKAHAWGLQTINGYFISPHFSLGVGLGLDGHHNPNYNTLPVFLDARAYFAEERNSFYSYIDIGPTIKIGGENSELRKGVLFNIGIGYKFNVAKRFFLVSDIFYSHKTTSLTHEGIKTSDDVIKSNGIGVSIDVLF